MSDRLATANIDIDPELTPGAHNAVSVCLQLTPDERVTIITDEATCDIAAALRVEVEEIGSEHAVFVLENYATGPRRLDRPTKPEVTNA
jgi:aminopeptidase